MKSRIRVSVIMGFLILFAVLSPSSGNDILLKTKKGEWVSGILVQQSLGELTIRNGDDTQKIKVRDLSQDDQQIFRQAAAGTKSPMIDEAPIRNVAMSIADIYEVRNRIVGQIIKVPFNFRKGTQNKAGDYTFQFSTSMERPAIIIVPKDAYEAWMQMNEKDLAAERGATNGEYIYVRVEEDQLRNEYSGDAFSGLVLKCVGRRIENGKYVWLTKSEQAKLNRNL